MTTRRGFMQSILALGVAPFVVKAGSLMATRVPESGLMLDGEIGMIDRFRFIETPLYEDGIPDEMARQLGARMALVTDMVMYGACAHEADLRNPGDTTVWRKYRVRV